MTDPGSRPELPSPIDPTALLRHARFNTLDYPPLVSSGDPPPAEEIARFLNMLPKRSETDYRRSVSAAYFALFHAITLRAASMLASGRSRHEQHQLARDFTHRDLRTAAMWVTRDGTPAREWIVTVESLRGDEAIRKLASVLLLLRGERVHADYNHLTRFSQGRAFDAIRMATEGVRVVTSPSFVASDVGQEFLRMVAAQARARS